MSTIPTTYSQSQLPVKQVNHANAKAPFVQLPNMASTYFDLIIGAINMLIVSTVHPKHGSRLSHSIIPVALESTRVTPEILGFTPVVCIES